MTSLVTGACGFLGGHVCEVLVQAGHDVRAADRAEAWRGDRPRDGVFPSVIRGLSLEPASLDGELPLAGVTRVFHAGPPDETAPVCRAAVEAGVHQLVLFSGAEVYGPNRSEPCPETAPTDPADPAARELLRAEQAALATPDLDVYVLRAAGVYGPRAGAGRGWGGRLVRLAQLAVAAAPSNLDRPVSLIHVRDVARAGLHLVATEAEPGIYNVTNEDELTERELVRRVALLSGHPFVDLPPLPLGALRRLVRRLDRRIDGPADLLGSDEPRLDTTRLSATGFQLEFPEASRGVRDTLTWFKQEGRL